MTIKSRKQESAAVRRVLIYRLGSLGDTVIALPALHLVKRAFPAAERRLLTNFPVNVKAPPATAILEHTGLIDGYFRYASGSRSPFELMKLWWTIRRWRPDVLVYLAASRGVASAKRDERYFRLCGIRHLIGVSATEDLQQNRWQPEHGALEPEAERLARNIDSLGDARIDAAESWDLHLTTEEKARADSALGVLAHMPLFAVSVGTKMQAKDWGRDNWRALLRQLAAHYPGYALALYGAHEEDAASEFACDGWRQAGGGPVVNLCGKLTPRQSAAALRHARLFIGHDSGPSHLAAAVQTPCIAIFSARNKPRVWFPYGSQHRVIYHKVDCRGCGLETCIAQKKKCLTSITVEEVLTQIRNLLSRELISG